MPPLFIQRLNLLLKILNFIGVVLVIIFAGTYAIPLWRPLGNLAAKGAVVMYVLTLTPGIIVRLGLVTRFPAIHQLLMLTRRQIGIATYLSSVAHVLFSYILPNATLLPYGISDWFGLIALVLFTPLFLTSNNLSQGFFKHHWYTLHKITHLIIWFVLLHLVFRSSFGTSLILALVLATDIFSWLKSFRH